MRKPTGVNAWIRYQRTRERLPVLPALVAWAEAERAATAQRLAAAASTDPGALLTPSVQTMRPTWSRAIPAMR